MQRRTQWCLAGCAAVGVFVALGIALPDTPPSSTDQPSASPSPSISVRVVERPVPGPTKTVTVQAPANPACLKAGELAEKVEAASAEYSKQVAPIRRLLDKATEGVYSRSIKDLNEAGEDLDDALRKTDGAAQDLAFAREELQQANKTCRDSQ